MVVESEQSVDGQMVRAIRHTPCPICSTDVSDEKVNVVRAEHHTNRYVSIAGRQQQQASERIQRLYNYRIKIQSDAFTISLAKHLCSNR